MTVNAEQVPSQNGQAHTKISTWQYDLLGRLTSEQIRDNNVPIHNTEYQHDAVGNVTQKTSNGITTTYSYAYDAYGEIIASSGSTANSYKYAGDQYDTDLGMYYNRARYYNQNIGRFSQMDSWQGQGNNPITLNKYLYANASPTMYTDPSGYMSLGSFSFGGFATLGYATASRTVATNIGPRLINTVIKPIAISKRVNQTHSFTNLLYRIVKQFCMTGDKNKKISDRCKPDMGLIVYGKPHGELTEHIYDAYGALNDAQVVLRRRFAEHDRGWLRKYKSAGQACFNSTAVAGNDCDEYPFATTVQGGQANFDQGNVSIRTINASTNRSGGSLLKDLYNQGGVGTGDDFITLASTSVPISFYIGSNGYSSISLRQ